MAPGPPTQDRLRQQAHELAAALISTFQPAPDKGSVSMLAQGASGVSRMFPAGRGDVGGLLGQPCPVTGAMVPPGGFAFDKDRLRRQAHEFIESLLVTFSQATGEKPVPYEDQVPLIRCVTPVQAGSEGYANLRVSNDEETPCEVTLYCTNFVADSGYEILSLRVTVSPRTVTIPAKGDAGFEIKIAVPQQAPKDIYSGLIQAMGSKYVKAVLSVEVL
jgi:hypothetical protein